MLITKRNEYALQAMIRMARLGRDDASSAGRLAGALRTSPALMAKICQSLAKAGLLKASRGRGGGLVLARDPRRIRASDVFAAVDGRLMVSECMERGRCKNTDCPLYAVLSRLQADLDRDLTRATLADLARQHGK